MFFARVNVGKYKEMASDKNIKMPPEIDNDQNVKINNTGKSIKRRYDSIKGNTQGSDVFIIYANKKAYPEYLITYR